MIVGITGLHQDTEKKRQTIGAGKDAAAARLIEKHGFVRIGIADHLKRICKEVFQFTDEQLWGPSEMRNKPDRRYPRGGLHGADNMKTYLKLKQEREELEKSRHEGYEQKHRDALRSEAEFEAMAYLTPRYALQQLGTEWGRSCYDPIWIDDALRIAHTLLKDDRYAYHEKLGLWEPLEGDCKPTQGVVFSDVRFHNEFNAIKKQGGKLIRVRRFSWLPFDTRSNAAHQSETELLGYGDDKFDYIIDNGGDLHHLGLLVDRMMDTFKGRVIPYDESQKDVPPGLRQPST